eukprot:3145486-Alexandrium_andersonii.AAC.1
MEDCPVVVRSYPFAFLDWSRMTHAGSNLLPSREALIEHVLIAAALVVDLGHDGLSARSVLRGHPVDLLLG